MIKLTQSLDGVTIKHSFKFSLNEEAKKAHDSKTMNATFSFDGLLLADALDKAVRQATIDWVHANRDDIASFTDDQKLVIMVKGAGRKQVDNVAAAATEYSGADAEAQLNILMKVTGATTVEELETLLKTGAAVDVTDL